MNKLNEASQCLVKFYISKQKVQLTLRQCLGEGVLQIIIIYTCKAHNYCDYCGFACVPSQDMVKCSGSLIWSTRE